MFLIEPAVCDAYTYTLFLLYIASLLICALGNLIKLINKVRCFDKFDDIDNIFYSRFI